MDIFVFVTFLTITLIVGLYNNRQAKTIRDYALGGKNFSTLTLTATIVATWFGGGSLYYGLPNIYSKGLFFVIALLGPPICLFIMGQVLAVRMQEFMHNVSVAEAMGSMYGRTVQMVSAVSGIAGEIGGIAIQFKVIGNILALILGAQSESFTIVAAAIVILYSTMGGIKAVTFTDVVQFFTFGTFLPMLALIVWGNLQDPQQVVTTLAHNPNFSLKEVVGWNAKFIGAIALMLYFAIPGVNAPAFQRISMARNIKQVRHAFTYSAFIALLLVSLLAWVGILLLADNPHLAPNKLVSYLIDKYTYVGFKGLLLSGIVALAMSTADSSINSCAVLFANDLVAPLGFRTAARSAFTARVFAFAVSSLALLLALYETDLLSLLLLSGSFYMPIVSAPMLLAIFGFRSTPRAVLMGMSAGFAITLLGGNFLAPEVKVVSGMMASLALLLGSHYLLGEPGGWQQVSPDSFLGISRAARKEAWQQRYKAFKNFSLYRYLQKNLPQYEGVYSLFGFYTIAATYTAFYTIGESDVKAYQDIYEGIYHTVLFATTAFLTFPIWPPTVKSYRFITFFWPLGIGGILFFAGTLLVIMSQFHTMQVMVLMINLLIAVLLLKWSLALILALGGTGLGVLFFHYYTGEALPWGNAGSLQFRLFYGLLLFTSFLIALFRGKQAHTKLDRKNEILTHLHQETQASLLEAAAGNSQVLRALQNTGMEHLLTIARDLQKIKLAGADAAQMQSIQTKLIPMACQLQGIDTKAQDYLRLHITTFSIAQWIQSLKDQLQDKDLRHCVRVRQITQYQELKGDVERLTQLLVKSIVALQNVSTAQPEEEQLSILVCLEDTRLSYPIPDVAPGYRKQIPALRIVVTTASRPPLLAASYEAHLASASPRTPATTQEFIQRANAQIIKAHYGYAWVEPQTLLYVVPIDVQEVRPKDMDKAYMELGSAAIRADDHFKNDVIDAQAQEKDFLAAVEQRSQADLGLVRAALELIKCYHGPVNRHSQEPFYLHPLAVAQIVLDYNTDEATILGALLHDVVEDTSLLLQYIETVFGEATAAVVNVVTHLQSTPGSIYKVKLSAEENLQLLERTGNQRGLYVKLADRMHNMRTIEGHREVTKQKRIAQETMEVFVPLAARLALPQAVEELKERCFKVLIK